jgi:hypothetical protein
MVDHGLGNLHGRPLSNEDAFCVVQAVGVDEGEGPAGEPGELRHSLAGQVCNVVPEEEPSSESPPYIFPGSADPTRGNRAVRVEPSQHPGAFDAEEGALRVGRTAERLVGVAEVSPDRLLFGKSKSLDGDPVRCDQAGYECTLRNPPGHQREIQCLLHR